MTGYPDTSFLASLYGMDANSAEAAEEFQSAQPLLLLSPFGEFEILNAFELMAFRRAAPLKKLRDSLRVLQSDIERGVLVRKDIPQGVYERAQDLSRRYTHVLGSRGMDILHVAIALELGAETFFTFDRRQHKLARAAGLRIRPAP